jgi:cytochrome c oxidase subunit III
MSQTPLAHAGSEAPHEHPRFLAHHFHSPKQQFEAGKLGMWVFLITEVLLFGGLFCAYAVYRANHPEIFVYAHQFLDKSLGAINTCVLIFSSLTAAWAVRCAQLDQRRGLIACLAITLACASVFLGIKYVEYKHKWESGLRWARLYAPDPQELAAHATHAQPSGHAPAASPGATAPGDAPRHAGIFFSIYFTMTGLHAIHVIAGMAVLAWILSRAVRGHFTSQYFGPVDYAALYWHLVDLIWIYLFPLLYLIQ